MLILYTPRRRRDMSRHTSHPCPAHRPRGMFGRTSRLQAVVLLDLHGHGQGSVVTAIAHLMLSHQIRAADPGLVLDTHAVNDIVISNQDRRRPSTV